MFSNKGSEAVQTQHKASGARPFFIPSHGCFPAKNTEYERSLGMLISLQSVSGTADKSNSPSEATARRSDELKLLSSHGIMPESIEIGNVQGMKQGALVSRKSSR